ncbi:PHD finger protein EHD3 [Amaranthus tricolor]|uniref:PHD finger protein EHD3 n=1 Tax=Amaranthus tricolor TaxID=29722 RepID=UPI00258C8077|nr:PHD finger protein EHD3 [Amaranthus tricolor]
MVIQENCNGHSIKINNGNSNCTSNRVNGFLHGRSSGSGSDNARDGASLRTYKRRNSGLPTSNCKVIDLEKLPCSVSANSDDKMVKELVDIGLQKKSCEQVCDPKINCHSLLNGSDDCSYQHWRSVLESICHSLNLSEGGVDSGLQHCLNNALRSNPGSSHANLVKDIVLHHNSQALVLRSGLANGNSAATGDYSAAISNGAPIDLGHSTVSRLCEDVFFRLVTSGKFASLCKLLSENFYGLKIEKFLDFSLINLRMKENAYETTPTLFASDIQQIWSRLRLIGSEMVSLSNDLSELSRGFCREPRGGAELDTSRDKKDKLSSQKCDVRIKQEEPDASVFCTCRQCGERSDGKDCLVCDSCEVMFHLSCIEPAVKEIPHKSWYCANCTASGFGSPHEDCAVCERLIANSGVLEIDAVPISEDRLGDDEECSDGIIETGVQVFKGSKRLPCKVCGCILNNGEEFQVCEHRYCQYKYYHIRCLTNKELKSYGPRWYCPSCLCRTCLTDKDDDDLVMCDGCDHGYHIYCMNPPRTSIPKGKWFCPKCDVGIKAIRKVKKFYEDLERKQTKSEGKRAVGRPSKKSKQEFKDAVNGSGGMDMLLTAARTLNNEDFDVQDRKR